MSNFNLQPLDSILAEFASGDRSALLPALYAAQSYYGYLPEPVAARVGQALGVPLADVYGVIDFYSMFYSQPAGETVIQLCGDPACALAGAEDILYRLCRHLDMPGPGVSPDGKFGIERAPCLGLCEHAPAALVGETPLGQLDPKQVESILEGIGTAPHARVGGDVRILTTNCDKGRPTSLEEYRESGGYAGLRKALSQPPQAIIAEVKASGLVGRGGAAFPTGVKWEGTASAEGQPKYVVCNADESEPGTFKDRVLMEGDPHRLLEGMLIAAYAVGAHHGYIYVRGEYSYAANVLSWALEEARQAGLLGENILGSGYNLDIEIRRGAGAYICGEETALFESIEGKRGFPRVKPPFPTTHGLFSKPTVVNNVETLCNIPTIIAHGAKTYRQLGTAKSPGPKLFCVSGDIARPGVYEVPFGASLRHLLFGLAGGVPAGRKMQAILFGGAAGTFATPDHLDVRLTFEDLRQAGLILGSGVIMVFDERRDLRDTFTQLARFFAHESCGKCYPCQLGTQRQYEILERIAGGGAIAGDVGRLTDVGWTMTDSSLCGLGQTAATAVLSAIKLWPELFEQVQPTAVHADEDSAHLPH
ncbi:MAG: NADH-quinone oxidoreductase subunit NuoF [Anaerolineales bacterium]